MNDNIKQILLDEEGIFNLAIGILASYIAAVYDETSSFIFSGKKLFNIDVRIIYISMMDEVELFYMKSFLTRNNL